MSNLTADQKRELSKIKVGTYFGGSIKEYKKNPIVLDNHNLNKKPLGKLENIKYKNGKIYGIFIPRKGLTIKEKDLLLEVGFINKNKKNKLIEISSIKTI
jgi:hypothetical protein